MRAKFVNEDVDYEEFGLEHEKMKRTKPPATGGGRGSTLRFSDGGEFDTSGPLRAEKRSDGWYIIGDGTLMAVDSYEDAIAYLSQRTGKRPLR